MLQSFLFGGIVIASEFDFNLEGLDELREDLEKAITKCPVQAKETLKQLGKEFRKTAYHNANAVLKPHTRAKDDKKGSIKRKWDSKVIDEGLGATALIWNSARHFHLIENGHNIVRGDQIVGFAPGKHIMEKTREDYKEVVPERFEQMIDDILKGENLD